MTAFAGAIDAIFADANFGRDATYRVAGEQRWRSALFRCATRRSSAAAW